MIRNTLIIFMLLSFGFTTQASEVWIVPRPQEISESSGKFIFKQGQIGVQLLNPDTELKPAALTTWSILWNPTLKQAQRGHGS